MNKIYIATIDFHHNSDRQPWSFNINAKDENEALLIAYREAIYEEFFGDEKLDIEEIRPILETNELVIETENIGPVVLWNENPDKYGDLNRGCGPGENMLDTSKSINVWIHIERRRGIKASLVNSVQAYNWCFDKLPSGMLNTILRTLDKHAIKK